MGRYDILRRIEQLDPERDHLRIYYLSTGFDFSWDTTRALEPVLYRTYCVPSISKLLDKTGEFTRRPQRRYDDTAPGCFPPAISPRSFPPTLRGPLCSLCLCVFSLYPVKHPCSLHCAP